MRRLSRNVSITTSVAVFPFILIEPSSRLNLLVIFDNALFNSGLLPLQAQRSKSVYLFIIFF